MRFMKLVFGVMARWIVWLGLGSVFVLSGCAQMQKLQNPSEPSTPEVAPVVKKNNPAPAPAPLMSLKEIFALAGGGEQEKARAALKTYLSKNPKNRMAQNLQKQLTVDPLKALGPPASTYVVQPGDTLGGLAARFLGNPIEYVILGRYNKIRRAQDIQVGQTLKIPSLNKLKALPTEQIARSAGESADKTIPSESDRLKAISSGALAVTPAAPVATPKRGQTGAIVAKPAPASVDQSRAKAKAIAKTRALTAQQAGLAAMKKHHLETARTDFTEALSIDPDLEPAKTRLAQVNSALVRQYHEDALVAYRNQQLGKAIALWNKALAIDPNYEPALGYRARALELKRRLGQLSH